jgi:hypothetical protein
MHSSAVSLFFFHVHMALAVAALQATEKCRVTMLAGTDAETVVLARANAVAAWQACRRDFTRPIVSCFLNFLQTGLVPPMVLRPRFFIDTYEVVLDFEALVVPSVQITLKHDSRTGRWDMVVASAGRHLRHPSACTPPDVFSALWKTHRVLTPSQFVFLEPYLAACMSLSAYVGPQNVLAPGCPWQWAVHLRMVELLGHDPRDVYVRSRVDAVALKAAVWRAVGRGWVPDTVRPRITASLASVVGSTEEWNFVKVAAVLYIAGLCPQDVMETLFRSEFQVPCVTLTALTLLLGGVHGPPTRYWGAAWQRVQATWVPWVVGDASLFLVAFGTRQFARDAWALSH